jgi:hypothetical protein
MPDGGNSKTCGRCGEIKPADDFSWRRREKGQRDSLCRPCRSQYGKEHYAANRQRYIDQAAAVKERVRRERTLLLLEFFESHLCVDCGEADPVVLEFDHLRDKAFNIGRAFSYLRWQGKPSSTRWRSARLCVPTAIAVVRLGGEGRCGRYSRPDSNPERAGDGDRTRKPRAWKARVLPVTPRPRVARL